MWNEEVHLRVVRVRPSNSQLERLDSEIREYKDICQNDAAHDDDLMIIVLLYHENITVIPHNIHDTLQIWFYLDWLKMII